MNRGGDVVVVKRREKKGGIRFAKEVGESGGVDGGKKVVLWEKGGG